MLGTVRSYGRRTTLAVMALIRVFGLGLVMLLPLSVFGATNEPAGGARVPEAKKAETVPLVELRGRVVCVAEEMHRLYGAGLPTGHEHLYGFRTSEGKYYTLLRVRFSEAMFSDQRFREKELLIKGRVFPGAQILEPAVVRSIRNGVICDLYYYCDVCDIQSVAPGLCECCQGPTELVEKPLGE